MAWIVDAQDDHGATGDGVSDDTAALQSALDDAAGRVLAVPPGRYLTNRLWVRPGTRVELSGGATLKFLPQLSTDWGGVLNVAGTEGDPIRGVEICGSGIVDGSAGEHESSHLNVEGIDLEHAVDCAVRGVTVVDAESEGIDFDASEDCTVDGVTLRSCGGFGVHLSHGNTRIRVVNALAVDCGHTHQRGGFDTHAIAGTNTTVDCSYVGCVAVDCYRGFWIKADRTSLTGCRSEGGTVNDLRISNGSGTSVSGFRSKNSDANGITVEGDAERVALDGVTVRTATQTGIRVLGAAEAVSITGSHVTSCGGHGIHFSGTDGAIVGNLVKGNASSPQIRDTGSGNLVTANAT